VTSAQPAAFAWRGFDGAAMAGAVLGEGRPIILLHGLFSSAAMNWQRYGTAAVIAATGRRVIMPDFRGHGASAAPHDPAAWPTDVLALDVAALVAEQGLTDFDIAGYSLGGRTLVRCLARGMAPARAIIAGMGLEGLTGGTARAEFFRRVIDQPDGWPPGSAESHAAAFMRQNGVDATAMRLLLGTFVATPADRLAGIDTPALVLCGSDDRDNGSAPALAAALPRATLVEIPGNHMSVVTRPAFGAAIAGWLGPA
jgi:pimeloyl-ACP methyl ester carboxylesterase